MDVDQIKGKLQNVFGKAEQAVGEAIGNQNLANPGTEDRVKGAATETWGNAKDAVHSVGDTTETRTEVAREHASAHGESLRDRIADGAEHLKNTINDKLDGVKDHEAERREHLNRTV